VKVENDENLSTPVQNFKTEADAMGWARMKADHAYNKMMNRQSK
jgi:hypothetical protein